MIETLHTDLLSDIYFCLPLVLIPAEITNKLTFPDTWMAINAGREMVVAQQTYFSRLAYPEG